jgi:hypothetical protein
MEGMFPHHYVVLKGLIHTISYGVGLTGWISE